MFTELFIQIVFLGQLKYYRIDKKADIVIGQSQQFIIFCGNTQFQNFTCLTNQKFIFHTPFISDMDG